MIKDLLNSFNFRHACKIFDKNRKIEQEDFNIILESARLSPSSFGFEPWKFIVLRDKNIKDRLLPYIWGAQNILPTASEYVVILARRGNKLLSNSDYITHMLYNVHKINSEKAEARREKYKTFQESDFNLTSSPKALFDWSSKQSYIALANMMTTAAVLKIDSCAIEGFNMKKLDTILSEELGYNIEEFGISVMVAFGYRLNEQPIKTRQSIEDIVEYK